MNRLNIFQQCSLFYNLYKWKKPIYLNNENGFYLSFLKHFKSQNRLACCLNPLYARTETTISQVRNHRLIEDTASSRSQTSANSTPFPVCVLRANRRMRTQDHRAHLSSRATRGSTHQIVNPEWKSYSYHKNYSLNWYKPVYYFHMTVYGSESYSQQRLAVKRVWRLW